MILLVVLMDNFRSFSIPRRQLDDCDTYTYFLCNYVESFPWTGCCPAQPCHCAVPHICLTHNSIDVFSNALHLSGKSIKARLMHYFGVFRRSIHIIVSTMTDLDTRPSSCCDSAALTKQLSAIIKNSRMKSSEYHHIWCTHEVLPEVLPHYWPHMAMNPLASSS